jgi:hypothetical protein
MQGTEHSVCDLQVFKNNCTSFLLTATPIPLYMQTASITAQFVTHFLDLLLSKIVLSKPCCLSQGKQATLMCVDGRKLTIASLTT